MLGTTLGPYRIARELGAGGIDVFPELSKKKSAPERIVTPQAVIEAAPDIIIGSWCGKKFRPDRVAARVGWSNKRRARGVRSVAGSAWRSATA